MNKISTSTKLLIALAALVVVLAASLFFLTPQERWSELWTLHNQYFRSDGWNAAAGDAGLPPPFFHHGYRHMGPRGHAPFFPFLLMIVLFFVAARFLHRHRRSDSSLSILEERFAEGKIDEAEFKRKRTVLDGQSGKEE
jgi:hypothetical protein